MESPIVQKSIVQEDRRRSDDHRRYVLDHHINILPKSGELASSSHTRETHQNPQVNKSPRKGIIRPKKKDENPFAEAYRAPQKSIGKRPPWVGIGTSTSAMNGAEIQAPLGKMQRYHTNRQQKEDEYLLQTLRVHDDPNVKWRTDAIQKKIAMDNGDDDELPDVFVRLTDPARYPASHAYRFNEDGTGAGLEGRRDDIDHQINVQGTAKILRDDDPEMDSPHKPIMSWEEDKLRSDAYYSTDMSQHFKTEDAYDDSTMKNGVHGRLSSTYAIPKHKQSTSEYDEMQQVRHDYKVDSCHVFHWQAFTDEIGAG